MPPAKNISGPDRSAHAGLLHFPEPAQQFGFCETAAFISVFPDIHGLHFYM